MRKAVGKFKPFKLWMIFQRGKQPRCTLMGRAFPSKENALSYLIANGCPADWYPNRVEVRPTSTRSADDNK